MPNKLEDLARRVEHLLVRHAELQRTQQLLQQQVQDLTSERDALRTRMSAARSRLDSLIVRVPELAGPADGEPARRSDE
jgi:uncharacterized protein (TIGR02449 family)